MGTLAGLTACSQLLGIHEPVVEAEVRADAEVTDGPAPLIDARGDDAPSDAGRCEGRGVYCDDFERAEPRGEWDVLTTRDDASATIEAIDGERVLAVRSSTALGAALLERTLAGTFRRVHYEVEARWDALPAGGGHLFVRAGAVTGDGNLEMTYVYLDPGGVWFVQQRSGEPGAYVRLPLAASAGAWHRFVVDYEIGGQVQVTVDGATQVGPRAVEPFLGEGPLRISLGLAGVEPVGEGYSLRVDDLLLRAE